MEVLFINIKKNDMLTTLLFLLGVLIILLAIIFSIKGYIRYTKELKLTASTTRPAEETTFVHSVTTSSLQESSAFIESSENHFSSFDLSKDEFYFICSVVMNEDGYGSFDGMAAVAQCIYNAMEREGKDAYYIYKQYQYAGRKHPNKIVKEAVRAVFYENYRVTDEPILFFYAPKYVKSPWHESLTFVCEYDGNKFFKL